MKLLIYCTKGKLSLRKSIKDKNYYLDNGSKFNIIPKEDYALNGKIVAECDFEADKLTNCGTSFMIMKYDDLQESYRYTNKVARGSCLNYIDLRKYLGTKDGYAIHIKNLHIFEKPRELSDYCLYPKEIKGIIHFTLENSSFILISIKPEWLCKILNGEKTIEIRKKVLKEMLE